MVEYYTRIKDKILELEQFLLELETIVPENYIEYEKNIMLKAACERYFEKISETIFDICKLIIKNKGVVIKNNEVETLFKLRIIDDNLKNKLKKIKGMRNIIIHQYGDVSDKLMFDSIKYKLLNDSRTFIKNIQF